MRAAVPVLRRLALPLVTGIAAAVVLGLLGTQREFAWAWGMLAAAVILLVMNPIPDDPREDAPGPTPEKSYPGSEVSRLAWAVNGQSDAVGEIVARRVRAILRRRLARHGIDPDDDAQSSVVDARLGPGLWERLHRSPVRIPDIRAALDAADRLAAETDTEPAEENGA